MTFKTQKSILSNQDDIFMLYKNVATNIGGIARTADEITQDYIYNNLSKSIENGISFIIKNPSENNQIIAEIHCYKPEPKVFSHVLSDLTIVVDPGFQHKGLGKLLFTSLLKEITDNRSEILRVELIARESNQKAIDFYQSLGFTIEGRFENRIVNSNRLEADIPMAWFNKTFNAVQLN